MSTNSFIIRRQKKGFYCVFKCFCNAVLLHISLLSFNICPQSYSVKSSVTSTTVEIGSPLPPATAASSSPTVPIQPQEEVTALSPGLGAGIKLPAFVGAFFLGRQAAHITVTTHATVNINRVTHLVIFFSQISQL